MTFVMADLAANLGLPTLKSVEEALSTAADTKAACVRATAALAAVLHPGDAAALAHWLVYDKAGRLPWL